MTLPKPRIPAAVMFETWKELYTRKLDAIGTMLQERERLGLENVVAPDMQFKISLAQSADPKNPQILGVQINIKGDPWPADWVFVADLMEMVIESALNIAQEALPPATVN